MLIPEDKKRDYPSLSIEYDELTEQFIMEAWIKFAAAGVQGDREGRGCRAALYADELVEEFKSRFIKQN